MDTCTAEWYKTGLPVGLQPWPRVQACQSSIQPNGGSEGGICPDGSKVTSPAMGPCQGVISPSDVARRLQPCKPFLLFFLVFLLTVLERSGGERTAQAQGHIQV